jgi:hypothetical protein
MRTQDDGEYVRYEDYARLQSQNEEMKKEIGLMSSRQLPQVFNVIEIENLKSEIERLKKGNGWQPIASAPRDGTDILVATYRGSVYQMFWGIPFMSFREGNTSDEYKRWVTTIGHNPVIDMTTHWMPLPLAPKMDELS